MLQITTPRFVQRTIFVTCDGAWTTIKNVEHEKPPGQEGSAVAPLLSSQRSACFFGLVPVCPCLGTKSCDVYCWRWTSRDYTSLQGLDQNSGRLRLRAFVNSLLSCAIDNRVASDIAQGGSRVGFLFFARLQSGDRCHRRPKPCMRTR